jgi:hypothetical protein
MELKDLVVGECYQVGEEYLGKLLKIAKNDHYNKENTVLTFFIPGSNYSDKGRRMANEHRLIVGPRDNLIFEKTICRPNIEMWNAAMANQRSSSIPQLPSNVMENISQFMGGRKFRRITKNRSKKYKIKKNKRGGSKRKTNKKRK